MKILYVTTISDTMAFFTAHINMLFKQGHKVDMACNLLRPIDQGILEKGCRIFNLEFQRTPLKKDNYTAYKKLKKLIHDEEYDLVHTHTPVASACVRVACMKMKNVTVIYTAHGFHFFKGAPLINWLIYYSVERWLARYTDMLITINREDYERAKNSFKAARVEYLPGVGLDTKKFGQPVVDKLLKRREIGIPEEALVVLSVGELNKNKNHETVIKALAQLNNPNIFYVICGAGDREGYLKDLAASLGIADQVKLLGYRRDIREIHKATDLFVFPSYREGLPVSLMEAMASGLPVVCSNVRGNIDLIEDGKGGYMVEPDDINGFAIGINEVLENIALRERMGNENQFKVKQFGAESVLVSLLNIYTNIDKKRLNV